MLANIPELFDSMLVIAGLALVVTGLVMFISSKSGCINPQCGDGFKLHPAPCTLPPALLSSSVPQ